MYSSTNTLNWYNKCNRINTFYYIFTKKRKRINTRTMYSSTNTLNTIYKNHVQQHLHHEHQNAEYSSPYQALGDPCTTAPHSGFTTTSNTAHGSHTSNDQMIKHIENALKTSSNRSKFQQASSTQQPTTYLTPATLNNEAWKSKQQQARTATKTKLPAAAAAATYRSMAVKCLKLYYFYSSLRIILLRLLNNI